MKLLAPLVAVLVAGCPKVAPPPPPPVVPETPLEPLESPPVTVSPEASLAASHNDEGLRLWRSDQDLVGAADRFREAVRLDLRGAYFFNYCGVLHQLFRGMARPAINVQAVAFDGRGAECHPADWQVESNDVVVNVRCFRAGTPADSKFSLLLTTS